MNIINTKSALVFASLFGVFCLGNAVSAYSTETLQPDDITGKETILYTGTCDELDYLISNGVPDPHLGYVNITLSNDCQKDLVIPSGKKVRLSLKYLAGYSIDPDTGEKINTRYENGALTNNSGDTITVEKDAVLVLSGEASNTTANKTVLNNKGSVILTNANLIGDTNGYVAKNSGTLSTDRGTTFNNSRLDNTGTFYVTGGRFLYHDVSKYLPDGCKLVKEGEQAIWSGDTVECRSAQGEGFFVLPEAIPNGATVKLVSKYPEIANALWYKVKSFDNSILEVTGNALEGFTLRPKKSGSVWLTTQNYGLGVGRQYSVVYEVENANDSVKDYLANHLSTDIIRRIIAAVTAHDKLFMDFDISQLSLEDISSAYKELVNNILEKGNLLGYFDIDYILKGQTSGELANIDDLGDEDDDNVDVSVDLPENLPEVERGKTRYFFVVRIHEDGTRTVVDKIGASERGGRLHFKSGKFSTYAIAYEDKEDVSAPNSGANTTINEASAKTNAVGAILSAMVLAGAFSMALVKKNKA